MANPEDAARVEARLQIDGLVAGGIPDGLARRAQARGQEQAIRGAGRREPRRGLENAHHRVALVRIDDGSPVGRAVVQAVGVQDVERAPNVGQSAEVLRDPLVLRGDEIRVPLLPEPFEEPPALLGRGGGLTGGLRGAGDHPDLVPHGPRGIDTRVRHGGVVPRVAGAVPPRAEIRLGTQQVARDVGAPAGHDHAGQGVGEREVVPGELDARATLDGGQVIRVARQCLIGPAPDTVVMKDGGKEVPGVPVFGVQGEDAEHRLPHHDLPFVVAEAEAHSSLPVPGLRVLRRQALGRPELRKRVVPPEDWPLQPDPSEQHVDRRLVRVPTDQGLRHLARRGPLGARPPRLGPGDEGVLKREEQQREEGHAKETIEPTGGRTSPGGRASSCSSRPESVVRPA